MGLELDVYDTAWPLLFDQEANRLRQLFLPQPVAVEHIGSTAIPGMAARPVIDIFVGVSPLLPLVRYEQLFLHTEYTCRPPFKTGRYSFYRPALQVTGYSVHLLPLTGFYQQGELLLRDFLRTHPKAAAQACTAKQAAFAQCRSDSAAYAQAKAALQAGLLQTALTAQGTPFCAAGQNAAAPKANTVPFPVFSGTAATKNS